MKTFCVRMLGEQRTTKIKASKLDDNNVGRTRFLDEAGDIVAIVMHSSGMIISEQN